jgi:hypothetical protein
MTTKISSIEIVLASDIKQKFVELYFLCLLVIYSYCFKLRDSITKYEKLLYSITAISNLLTYLLAVIHREKGKPKEGIINGSEKK